MTVRLLLPAALLSTFLLGACHRDALREAPGAAPAATTAPAGATDNLKAVAWMQTSAEYQALTRQVFRNACDSVARAVQDPGWSALPAGEQSAGFEVLPPAVIADIDETLLDNSPAAVRQMHAGTSFDPTAWATWVNEVAARPLPGALDFARCLGEHGVTLVYISNRNHGGEREATIKNLRKAGFPLAEGAEDLVLLRDDPRGATADRSDKGARRRWAAQRYRIVALMGDNLGDFMDGVGTTPAAREALMAPYADYWGERWFVLANPSYGSWEKALINDCPAAEKTAHNCELDALKSN